MYFPLKATILSLENLGFANTTLTLIGRRTKLPSRTRTRLLFSKKTPSPLTAFHRYLQFKQTRTSNTEQLRSFSSSRMKSTPKKSSPTIRSYKTSSKNIKISSQRIFLKYLLIDQ